MARNQVFREKPGFSTRDVPRILAWLKCDPDTPAAALTVGHNECARTCYPYRLEAAVPSRREGGDENDALPRIVRSEGLA